VENCGAKVGRTSEPYIRKNESSEEFGGVRKETSPKLYVRQNDKVSKLCAFEFYVTVEAGTDKVCDPSERRTFETRGTTKGGLPEGDAAKR
jgi:hypothetical protein